MDGNCEIAAGKVAAFKTNNPIFIRAAVFDRHFVFPFFQNGQLNKKPLVLNSSQKIREHYKQSGSIGAIYASTAALHPAIDSPERSTRHSL